MWRDTTWTVVRTTAAGTVCLAALLVLAAVAAIHPGLAAACAPLLALMAVAASQPAATARLTLLAAGTVALVGVGAAVTLAPRPAVAAVLAVAAASIAARGAWSVRAAIASGLVRAAAVTALMAVWVAVAVSPQPVVAAVAIAGAGALAARGVWSIRGPIARVFHGVVMATGWVTLLAALVAIVVAVAVWPAPIAIGAAGAGAASLLLGVAPARQALARSLVMVASVLAGLAVCAGVVVTVAAWPALALLAAIVFGVLVLAWHRPALGLAAAVLLFGFEGSVKILLGLEGTPLGVGNRATGAAALDLALFGAIAAVLVRDRLRTPRAIWSAAGRFERIAVGVLAGWLALSIPQIAQSGELFRGAQGFRLSQAYTAVALAALVVFAQRRARLEPARIALAVGLVVSLYAAMRVAIGPTDAEAAYALAQPTVTTYGGAMRAVGSFSSAVGLGSFLTPLAVFALALGFLAPRLRVIGLTVGALSLVGLIGSYGRTSLLGIVLGLAFVLAVAFIGSDIARRRRLMVAGLATVTFACACGGVLVASQASPQLRERAQGLLNPLADESMRMRLEGWETQLEAVPDHPLGRGVGFVGAATDPTGLNNNTTDSSFLKVLVEQGVPGFVLFVFGILATVLVLTRRLRRADTESRTVGIAALGAFIAFLTLALLGETVEQPGKVVAWGLLGVAAAAAFERPKPPAPVTPSGA